MNNNPINIMPYENMMAIPQPNVQMPYENMMAMPQPNVQMPYENMMAMPQQCNQMPYGNMMAMPQDYNQMMGLPQTTCPMMQPNYPMMQPNYPMMPMQQMYYPMMTMPEDQLENMYPKTYKIINPVVQNYCDKMEMKNGVMSTPSKEQLDEMCENICKDVEADVDKVLEAEIKDEKKQLGYGGRFILRDLAGILVLRELIRRRRAFGYPGYGFPGYGGYYGY